MLVSLVICTYNNAESLAITLRQLANQIVSHQSEIELIVVNNNSSDATPQVIDEFRHLNVPFKYFVESRQGLSHARNLGVEKSLGEYILFTDDDADIQENWIAKYVEKIKLHKADCLFGKILVIWDRPKPWWYDDRYQGFFAVIDHGDQPFAVTSFAHPFFGKNFCVKKSIIHEVGGFDPKLGRRGNVLLGGEETALCDYLVKHQKVMWYFPDVNVGHRLKEREYSEANIKRQHLACAKPIIWRGKVIGDDLWCGRSLGVLRNHLVYGVESFIAFFTRDKKERFFQWLQLRRAIVVVWFWIIGV